MILSVLLASIHLLCVGANHGETCEDEIARERAEDWRQHSCRSCKSLPLVASTNCPKMGFDCDINTPTTSNVLHYGCECSQLRCADANAALAVGGALLRKVRCIDTKWMTQTGDVAASGICARKCDAGICKTMPDTFFVDNPQYGQLIILPPDSSHPCAWGACELGGVGSSDDTTVTYDGMAEFSCSGDGRWKGRDGQRHDAVMCKLGLPCPLLTKLDAAQCSIDYTTDCIEPIVASTTAFVCPGDFVPMIGKDSQTALFDSITCNTEIGEWIYDMTHSRIGLKVLSQAEFNDLVPEADRRFSCA